MKHRFLSRVLCVLMCLCLLPLFSAFAMTVEEGGLSGTEYWPDGSDADSAQYIYSYSYPRVSGDEAIVESINSYYDYLVSDAIDFAVPMNGEMLEDPSVQSSTVITSRVTCQNDEYFSVLTTTENMMDGTASTVCSGQTFAMNGEREGNVISLPWLLGLLTDADSTTDTWLEERQTAKANELVWGLVWDTIKEQMDEGTVAYYPDLTYDTLSLLFYPETDYYLDENGDPVFFILPGFVAEESEGILLFPISLETLLDEL